ncbi:ABC transporter permease [Mycoplasma buteonis]|uniref:ABC transporter permease n=1 Tax=Mycoplasma buteonis TaxID=171280 RepID=UPI00056BF5F0|nr:ABC transporter permease [Mycoplasma buteonis]
MELVISFTGFFFCLILLGTLSGIFSERVGIVNIAINGFMVFGALMYTLISVVVYKIAGTYGSAWNQIWITVLAAIFTSLFAVLFGFATIKLKSDQTISGFAINSLSVGITSVLVLILLGVTDAGIALNFGDRQELALKPDTSWLNLVSFKVVVTILVVLFSWFALQKTRWGLRFKAIGENPQAADVAGVNVNKTKWQGVLIAGFIAGIAGSIYAQSNTTAFSLTKDVQGLGFIALAIMITSRWKVTLSIVVSLFFSALLSLSFYGVSLFDWILPYKDLISLLPYLITLIIMIATSKNSVGPAAAGIPYDKSKR